MRKTGAPGRIPSVREIMDDPRLRDAAEALGPAEAREAARRVQRSLRAGRIADSGPDAGAGSGSESGSGAGSSGGGTSSGTVNPTRPSDPLRTVADAVAEVVAGLPPAPTRHRRVVNATGVLVHTNLGRTPLSRAAVDAVAHLAGTSDLELDLEQNRRGPRGRGALDALRAAVPAAGGVHVVNNNAAALVLVATALAGTGRDIVVSRGELVEIGDGFRLPELLESTGARLREVGTTNRTTVDDYARAIGDDTAFLLQVHPSNFAMTGFVSTPPIAGLAALGRPLVVDIGSGLLAPHPLLPDEPDAGTALSQGAALVTASGDKLLGGPQAGLLLGDAGLVERLRRHPLARALRTGKLTLAALEATLRGPASPLETALTRPLAELTARADSLTRRLRAAGVDAASEPSESVVGGGGAPGVTFPSAAVALPADLAPLLRTAVPVPVLARVHKSRLLLDLRSVPDEDDEVVARAVLRAWERRSGGGECGTGAVR
ncbi:L-seryl-tRNA(Sec) selenium transferase [Streptomyces sp. NPDC094448]|uniref:L-seryl-tRNA(Sec) selenium transferase n=1 Tax=Streptomyces sp. NPDC094448 TaxID=3366063 RepID=UPI0038053CFB